MGSLDNHVVIIDEVHNLISRMINPNSKTGTKLYNTMLNAKNVKYIFLSGTPIINKVYELGIMANLLEAPSKLFPLLLPILVQIPIPNLFSIISKMSYPLYLKFNT